MRLLASLVLSMAVFLGGVPLTSAHHTYQHQVLVLGETSKVKIDIVVCDAEGQIREVLKADVERDRANGGDLVLQQYREPTAKYGDFVCRPIKGYVKPLMVLPIEGHRESVVVSVGPCDKRETRILVVDVLEENEMWKPTETGLHLDIVKTKGVYFTTWSRGFRSK